MTPVPTLNPNAPPTHVPTFAPTPSPTQAMTKLPTLVLTKSTTFSLTQASTTPPTSPPNLSPILTLTLVPTLALTSHSTQNRNFNTPCDDISLLTSNSNCANTGIMGAMNGIIIKYPSALCTAGDHCHTLSNYTRKCISPNTNKFGIWNLYSDTVEQCGTNLIT